MVVHTYQVIGAVRQALLLTEESESAQNGFVITTAPEFSIGTKHAKSSCLPLCPI